MARPRTGKTSEKYLLYKTKKEKFERIEAFIIISKNNIICICCGNRNAKWLQIDHKKYLKKGEKRLKPAQISRKIVTNKINPYDFQLLCGSCNRAKDNLDKCPINHSLD